MSHFSVLVIGDDVEGQLQPYHEYECTGIEDEYVVDVDRTDDARKEYEAFRSRFASFEECLADVASQYQNLDVDDAGVREEAKREWKKRQEISFGGFVEMWHGQHLNEDRRYIVRTNPNAKWDWWKVGGRWADWLNISQGKAADFDFVERRGAAAVEAADEWGSLKIDGLGQPKPWSEFREQYDTIEAARDAYAAHPFVQQIRARGPWNDPDNYLGSRQDYIDRRVRNACVPFAVVKDGEWHAKGDMGWFATVTNAQDPNDWAYWVNSLLDSLDPDEMLTVIDCHI